MNLRRVFYWFVICIALYSCRNKPAALFSLLPSSQTGIDFQNRIADTDTLNILDYLYYYNDGGVAIAGFNTQAVFFDYDHDGDLDMFLVNHSVHSNESYGDSSQRRIKNEMSGDKLFRNDSTANGRKFVEVTSQAGIYSSVIGYGLNVVVGDMNNDGWDDIYVINDFHENDYYYLNNHDGTFKEINR